MLALQIGAVLFGVTIVALTFYSAVRSFVLPRSAPDTLTRLVFRSVRRVFNLRLRFVRTYEEYDAILAMFAPIALLALPPFWLLLVTTGYTFIYWGVGVDEDWVYLFRLSGSSMLSLGFEKEDTLLLENLIFTETVLGLTLLALLIAYLPTIYSAFSKRETLVNLLAVRAGTPPSVVNMITLLHRIERLPNMSDFWERWEVWFAELEETHTSLAPLVFFRSPQPHLSWVTAAGTVLDTGAFIVSAVDLPRNPQIELCIRAGFLSMRRICDFFYLPYPADPHYPTDPISITRAEFEAAYHTLAAEGVPMKPDLELAWINFAGWRVNYDQVLLHLCALTNAPYALWSSDRAPGWNPLFEDQRA